MAALGSRCYFALPDAIGQYRYCCGLVVAVDSVDVILAVPSIAVPNRSAHTIVSDRDRCVEADGPRPTKNRAGGTSPPPEQIRRPRSEPANGGVS